MKISVVTVTLNCQDTIEKTILSVLNQRNADYELIVCDGCSVDATVDLINKYIDSISLFISEPDTGIYNAMNKALTYVSGDLVVFLNSGDLFVDDNTLARISGYFDDDTEVVIAREIIEGKVCETFSSLSNVSLYIDAFFPHQATFSKTYLYKEDGAFDESFQICADYDWILRECYLGRKIKWIDDVTSIYDADGISSTVKCTSEQYLISRKYIQLLEKKELIPFLEEYYADMFRRVFFRKLIKERSSNNAIIKSLEGLFKSRTVSIWGIGTIGKAICSFLLDNNVNIYRIIEADSEMQGKDYEGIKISDYSESEDDLIIVSSEYYDDEICDHLIRLGKYPGRDFLSYQNFSASVVSGLIRAGYDDQGFYNITGLDVLKYIDE